MKPTIIVNKSSSDFPAGNSIILLKALIAAENKTYNFRKLPFIFSYVFFRSHDIMISQSFVSKQNDKYCNYS